jgi:hypothetical protein
MKEYFKEYFMEIGMLTTVGLSLIGNFACERKIDGIYDYGVEVKRIDCKGYFAGGDVKIPARLCDFTFEDFGKKVRFKDASSVEGRFEKGDLVDVCYYPMVDEEFLMGCGIYRSRSIK